MTKQTPRAIGRPKLHDAADIERMLLQVALHEFRAHGYGGASMSQIVKVAGVSKTTLYSRFASKEALFRALVWDQIDRIASPANVDPFLDATDLENGLNAFANRMLGLSLQGELLEINRLILSEARRFPELGKAAADRMRLGVRRVGAFIRDCADRQGVELKAPECAAEVFVLMIRGWYIDEMLSGRSTSRKNREKWVAQAVQLFVCGWRDW